MKRRIVSVQRKARRHEDRNDDEQAGDLLGAKGAEVERDPDRNRRRRVAEVVHEVSEKRDQTVATKIAGLRESGDAEDREADEDGADAGTQAHDRAVDETMRVTVLTVVVRMAVVGVVGVRVHQRRPGSPESPQLDERGFTCSGGARDVCWVQFLATRYRLAAGRLTRKC